MRISVRLGDGKKIYFSADQDAWKFIAAVYDTLGYADNADEIIMEVKFEREEEDR